MPPKKHRHLTPEEKRELKKQKKIEKKLRLAEKKKQIKRDHLEREVKYGELTIKKYEKNWREMLIKVALPRMRQELEFAWHNFERVVDCKDFTISLLMDELRDSEEQYMLNFRAHSENMEKLMWLFHDRLEELQADFESECKSMQERCDNEFQDAKELYNENFEYLKTMLHQIELERREHNRLKKGEYFSRLDEVEVKDQLLLQKLRATLERKYQNMFEDMKHFIKNYNKQVRDRKKEHNLLKDQDDSIQELIAQQFKNMKKCYDRIRQLRQKYTDMKQIDGSRLSDLQAERNYFSNSFLTLKTKLESDKKDDFDKLALLSENAAKAFDCLEHLNKKGEMILSLAAVCRKLETQKEKILTFPLNTTNLPEIADIIDRDDTEEIEGVRPEMELFWQRLGQAFGVHYTLKREKGCLSDENQLLIDTHNEYCERLMYPPVQNYNSRVTIPKTDTNLEMAKYNKFRDHTHKPLVHHTHHKHQ
ncbi:dynein regulatory complex subunit 2-like [Tribolium madens]|uniref:dynein regulatory complex subunit 2-like n=1 Tax=Tribolium madens TaxID=41895 RepID=UPI001CF74F2E|nr:dynein regulatory complex subunit 2-like [Tribolium madens]